MNSPVDDPAYSEKPGLLVPLLKAPLEEGLDLAYTATVDKGMSGGGIFLGRELIGINSAHRDPLWPGQWHDERGQAVDELLNQKLDLVSMGISSKQIDQTTKAVKPPNNAELNRWVGIDCHKSTPPTKSENPASNTSRDW